MKNTKKGSNLSKALLMGTALVSLSSYQVDAATGTGAMDAIILTPIVVTTPTDLHFGAMTVAGATSGTVTITTGGVRSQGGAGGVTLVTGAGLESEAVLHIVAASGVNMDVAMAAATDTVTGPGGPMNVNAFDLGSGAGVAVVANIAAGTTTDINLGAVLTVPAGHTAGAYAGTYTVNVNYQ